MKNQEISWEELLAQWKAQFPVFRDNQPLAISTRKEMALRGLLESPAALQALVQHVRSDEYLGALASGGHRFNLDGSVERIINPAHVQSAARILAGELPRFGKPAATPQPAHEPHILETLEMQTRSVKATLVVTDFAKHLGIDSSGASNVPVKLQTPSGAVMAALNPKSFRKAQATFKEHDGNVNVIVNGELDLDKLKLESAGIVVQPKSPKAAQAAGESTTALATSAPEIKPAPLVIVKKKRVISIT
jgi:hypothetical protein